jgi:hypothetical protein
MFLDKLKLFLSRIFSPELHKIQTFTYFIPAPKQGLKGYREKQFDRIFYDFVNKGYEVLDFKTQQCQDRHGTSGMWVIFTLKALTEEANKLDLDSFNINEVELVQPKEEEFLEATETIEVKTSVNGKEIELPDSGDEHKEDIEGLYYIKDSEN